MSDAASPIVRKLCYRPGARHAREATWSEQNPQGCWRPYSYAEIVSRDKVSLDLSWACDERVEDAADLPQPRVSARAIADDLRAALGRMEEILADLEARGAGRMTIDGANGTAT